MVVGMVRLGNSGAGLSNLIAMRAGQELEEKLIGLPGVQRVKPGAGEYAVADLAWNGYEIELKSHAKSGGPQVTISLKNKRGRVEAWSLEKFQTAVTFYNQGAGETLSSLTTLDGLVKFAEEYGDETLASMRGNKDGRCTFIRKTIQTLRAKSRLPESQRPEKPKRTQQLRIWHVAWLLGDGVTVEQVKLLKKKGQLTFVQERPKASVVFRLSDIEEFIEKYGSKQGFNRIRLERWKKELGYDSCTDF